jgi:hypothetical protein
MRLIRMRLALALLVLLSASSALADRERPQELEREQPRPCKCAKREPEFQFKAVQGRDRELNRFTERVAGRARVHYNGGILQCLQARRASSAELSFAFAAGETKPRVAVAGAPALSACLAQLPWHSFTEAPRATTVRVRVSNVPLF